MTREPLNWDIFCTVIDNYGDIGICWRVARQLVREHGQQVRLWVDDLESFRRICPEVDPEQDIQTLANVEIRRWSQDMPAVQPADVVVEAFACRVPESFLLAMAARTPKPVWINLEYFSAEAWVAESHGLGSPHPRLPLTQYFFIPGIGPGTGGLLGSRVELQALAAFQSDAAARQAFWDEMLPPPLQGAEHAPRIPHLAPSPLQRGGEGTLTISLFAYDNPAIPGLIEALRHAGQPVRLLASEGKSLGQVVAGLGLAGLQAGESHSQGSLTVQVLPFVEQGRYDQLLWACDINFVRGEDSFIRAQHAGRPLVWQAYVQEDGAQWPKLEAFLTHYVMGLSPNAETALREAWRVWNAGENRPEIWREWLTHLPEYQKHARAWAGKLQTWPNLVEELARFAVGKV
jgi:uncharacterized repeat protein (TIGR03837 family)